MTRFTAIAFLAAAPLLFAGSGFAQTPSRGEAASKPRIVLPLAKRRPCRNWCGQCICPIALPLPPSPRK